MELGCDYIATGHYARVVQLANGRYAVCKSAAVRKDQTYALYNLTQEQLKRTLMPVGEYDKERIRQIAEEIGLAVAHKPDSQEICFIPDHDYAAYIERESGQTFPEGNFVDLQGRVLGTHKGIIHYTVGQRKGLGLSLGAPAFVLEIRPDTNEVVIGTNADTFHDRLLANRLNFMAISSLDSRRSVTAKIRYSHAGAACSIRMVDEDTVECHFKEPVRAITPGQAVVFYDEDVVVGGATIIKTI
jgi:tRNA-specific 2-thiouridylase